MNVMGQACYEKVFHIVGGWKLVQHNRYLRYAYMRGLASAARLCGTPVGRRTVQLRDGSEFEGLDLRDNMQAEMYFIRGYSLEEVAIVTDTLEPGDTFIDIGANIGLFTVAAGRTLGRTGWVYAFEPSKDTADLLQASIALNQTGGVTTVFTCALGDTEGQRDMHAPEAKSEDKGMRSFFQEGEVTDIVEVRTLDALMAEGSIKIHGSPVVKIDVEGAEMMVLQGMKALLIEHRPKLVLVETVDQFLRKAGSSRNDLVQFMRAHGYRDLPGNAGNGRVRSMIFNTAFVPNDSERGRPTHGSK